MQATEQPFFSGERLQGLKRFLTQESDEPFDLLAIVGDIDEFLRTAPDIALPTLVAQHEAAFFFLHATRQRFASLASVTRSLCHLQDCEEIATGSTRLLQAVLSEAVSNLGTLTQVSEREPSVEKRLLAIAAALVADDPAWKQREAFRFLISLSTASRSTAQPIVARILHPGRRRLRTLIPLLATAALSLAFIVWFSTRLPQLPAAESIMFADLITPSPINVEPPGKHAGTADATGLIRDGDELNRDGVEKLLSRNHQTDVVLFRITYSGKTILGSRRGDKIDLPAIEWNKPDIGFGTGWETFVLLRIKPGHSADDVSFSKLMPSDYEALASTADLDEVDRVLRAGLSAKEISAVTSWAYRHVGHEQETGSGENE